MNRPAPLTLRQKGDAVLRQRMGKIDPRLVAYSSFRGHFSDNPRAIFEELARREVGYEHHWLAADDHPFPDGVATLRAGTRSYFHILGRARYIVANNAMPQLVPKRGRTYLQTWHGTPLKRIGYDNARRLRDPAGLRRAAFDYRQWDYLVSQNRHSSEVFRTAFRYEGEILEVGYPRNDVLSSPAAASIRDRTRSDLNIPEGATVVLYAPTFRDGRLDTDGKLRFDLAMDLERMRAALGEEFVILLRLHYWVADQSIPERGGFVMNVSRYDDIRDLYLAADVMITDYSSTMFDFGVTRKPMIFFTYDLEEYRESMRGLYFDITEKAPGPLCRTTDDIIEALRALEDVRADFGGKYERFHSEFCYLDDGHASARIVDRVFT